MPNPRAGMAGCSRQPKDLRYRRCARGSGTGTITGRRIRPANGFMDWRADMPTGRTGFTAEAVNGRIYTIGGTTFLQGPGMHTVEEYNPATDQWAPKLGMPTARVFLQSGKVNGKIYALGGVAANIGPDILMSVEEFDAGVVSTAVEPVLKVASIWGAIKDN